MSDKATSTATGVTSQYDPGPESVHQPLVNPSPGLDRWNRKLIPALAKAASLRDGSLIDKLKIVCLCHSMGEAAFDDLPINPADSLTMSWPRLLQQRLNSLFGQAVDPTFIVNGVPRVKGGIPFIPAVNGSGGLNLGNGYFSSRKTGTWTPKYFNNDSTTTGLGRRYLENHASGSTLSADISSGVLDTFGADSRPTSLEIVYSKIPGGGSFRFDIGPYSASNPAFGGAQFASKTINTASGDVNEYYAVSDRIYFTGSPTALSFQITNLGNTEIRIEGFRVYCGDESTMVTVDNFSCGGANSNCWIGPQYLEAINRIAPDVVFVWLDYNDLIGVSPIGLNLALDKLRVQARGLRALSCSPSVVFIVGFNPGNGSGQPFPGWSDLNRGIKDICVANNCDVLSFNDFAGGRLAEDYAVSAGLKFPTTVHWTVNPGQQFITDRIVARLCSVLPTAPSFTKAVDNAYPIDTFAKPSRFAYSVARRLRRGHTTGIIRVRRSSDNTELDIGVTAFGVLDEAALTTFVGGGNGFITKIYDQTGNGNHLVQATSAQQARIVNSGTIDKLNGKPVAIFSGSQWYFCTALDKVFATQGFALHLVASMNNVVASGMRIFGGVAVGDADDYSTDASCIFFLRDMLLQSIGSFRGAQITTKSFPAYAALFQACTIYDGNVGTTYVNNVASTQPSATPPINVTKVCLGSQYGNPTFAGAALQGSFGELLDAGSMLGNRTAIDANQKAFWGTP